MAGKYKQWTALIHYLIPNSQLTLKDSIETGLSLSLELRPTVCVGGDNRISLKGKVKTSQLQGKKNKTWINLIVNPKSKSLTPSSIKYIKNEKKEGFEKVSELSPLPIQVDRWTRGTARSRTWCVQSSDVSSKYLLANNF